MAKIKVKDQEVEVSDEVAELLADETGVPFRNRAAEHRRKLEKEQKRREDLEEELAALKANKGGVEGSKTPLWTNAQPPQQQLTPQQLQYYQMYYPHLLTQYGYGYQAGNGHDPGMTPEKVQELARQEALRLRQQDEYNKEQELLRNEWTTYEDDKEALTGYLKEVGYEDDQIKEFGPRDLRLAHRAWKGEKKTPVGKRSPQAVVLDTGGGDDGVVSKPWLEDPDKVRDMDKNEFAKIKEAALARPRE